VKDALIKSYAGAIAVGWLFGQAALHFAYIFSTPLTSWLARREYYTLSLSHSTVPRFTLQDALPELIRCVVLLLIGYLLLRWLYYNKPVPQKTTDSVAD
jgi:hypothetical protein